MPSLKGRVQRWLSCAPCVYARIASYAIDSTTKERNVARGPYRTNCRYLDPVVYCYQRYRSRRLKDISRVQFFFPTGQMFFFKTEIEVYCDSRGVCTGLISLATGGGQTSHRAHNHAGPTTPAKQKKKHKTIDPRHLSRVTKVSLGRSTPRLCSSAIRTSLSSLERRKHACNESSASSHPSTSMSSPPAP